MYIRLYWLVPILGLYMFFADWLDDKKDEKNDVNGYFSLFLLLLNVMFVCTTTFLSNL